MAINSLNSIEIKYVYIKMYCIAFCICTRIYDYMTVLVCFILIYSRSIVKQIIATYANQSRHLIPDRITRRPRKDIFLEKKVYGYREVRAHASLALFE